MVYEMIDMIIEMYKKGFSIEKICKKMKVGRSYVELVLENI